MWELLELYSANSNEQKEYHTRYNIHLDRQYKFYKSHADNINFVNHADKQSHSLKSKLCIWVFVYIFFLVINKMWITIQKHLSLVYNLIESWLMAVVIWSLIWSQHAFDPTFFTNSLLRRWDDFNWNFFLKFLCNHYTLSVPKS